MTGEPDESHEPADPPGSQAVPVPTGTSPADPGRDRIDVVLVRRGLARSRAVARDLIAEGRIRVDGEVVTKASQSVAPSDARIDVEPNPDGDPAYVSRAAYKLAGALERFAPQGLQVAGRRVLDAGASTGGFTQVVLAAGARQVVALDVGHDQLAPVVCADPRVVEVSGTNLRDVAPGQLGDPFELIVGDLSFISLTLVLGRLHEAGMPGADVVLLVKPQFEVGRAGLGKGGVVTDPRRHRDAVRTVVERAAELGWLLRDLAVSSVLGTHGNREYVAWFQIPDDGTAGRRSPRPTLDELLADAGLPPAH